MDGDDVDRSELGGELHKMVLGAPLDLDSVDLPTLIFAMDCNQLEDSIMIKDFGFNLLKSLTEAMPTIMNSKPLASALFDVIHAFIDKEYAYTAEIDSDESIENRMLKANQGETDSAKSHRHQTFSILSGILELFKSCECSLKHAPRLETL